MVGCLEQSTGPRFKQQTLHLSVAELGSTKQSCKSKWTHQHVCQKDGAADAIALQFESVCVLMFSLSSAQGEGSCSLVPTQAVLLLFKAF